MQQLGERHSVMRHRSRQVRIPLQLRVDLRRSRNTAPRADPLHGGEHLPVPGPEEIFRRKDAQDFSLGPEVGQHRAEQRPFRVHRRVHQHALATATRPGRLDQNSRHIDCHKN